MQADPGGTAAAGGRADRRRTEPERAGTAAGERADRARRQADRRGTGRGDRAQQPALRQAGAQDRRRDAGNRAGAPPDDAGRLRGAVQVLVARGRPGPDGSRIGACLPPDADVRQAAGPQEHPHRQRAGRLRSPAHPEKEEISIINLKTIFIDHGKIT